MLHRRAPLLALAVAALGITFAARASLEAEASARGTIRNPAWLPQGRSVRAAAFGQRLLLADYYWLQAVQYTGETLLAKVPRWEALLPLLEIVTDLDPRYGYAYQVGGSNLAGLAGRYDEAERLLQKGMKALPDRWVLPFVHASNKFIFEQDYAVAAVYARRAAELGKKPHLALLAANLSALADTDTEYQAALAFLDQMQAAADTEELKDELQQRRVKIETYQALSAVERAIVAFKEARGRLPAGLRELVPGQLAALPADPSGGRLLYDPATGEVRSSVLGPRAPLRVTR
jgi:tetratricopeptide (TPR) repeat protein